MKLRNKLIWLVGVASALFLGSVLVYFSILSPLTTMEQEAKVFQALDRATASLQIEADLLIVKPFGDQETKFQATLDLYKKARSDIDGVIALPKASATLASAVQAIKNLGAIADTSLSNLSNGFSQLMDVIKDTNGSQNSTDLYGRSSYSQVLQAADTGKMANSSVTKLSLSNLVAILGTLNGVLSATRQVIEKKDAEIDHELGAIKEQSSLIGLMVILLAVAVGLVLSSMLARSITKALAGISLTVARVAAGDLRPRFGTVRKDEMGVLGRDIDNLLDSLAAAFQRIQAASSENLAVKDQLVQSVGTATSSAVQIEANSTSILNQLNKVDERIQASESDLNAVLTLLEAFHTRLGHQNQGVSDATKAVADLAQGIGRINSLSTQNRQFMDTLLSEADRGREVFDNSFSKVAEINDNVADIQDLAGAIAEIASQTNILALNAAIEAAHAGEAGKGFAVVADEISKLAAGSAASSSQIAETIKKVVGKIREAGDTRHETLEAFDAIGKQIGQVSAQGKDIDEELSRMNQGTHRIRTAMETLTTTSEETTREADRIGNVATKLGDTLNHVGQISHEVISNIGEITQGLGEISTTIAQVSTQSERLIRVGENLEQTVHAFRTESDSATAS